MIKWFLTKWYWLLDLLYNTFSEPKALRSKGEREVIAYLDKRGYKYKRELRIHCNTDFQKNIYIDFYLPNEKVFIEYNGRQHYEPVEYFGGEAQFERQQKRDAWVRHYCIDRGIKLIEIPYYSDVETYLNITLK